MGGRDTEQRLLPLFSHFDKSSSYVYGSMNTLRDDLTNQRFGHLTVMGVAGKTSRGQSIWDCLCDCGNHKNIRGYHLKGKKIRSCGCLKRETVNIKWSGAGEIARWMWNRFRIGAKRRKIEFDLTAEDMWKLAVDQDKKCSLTGETLTFVSDQRQQKNGNASLDRIDSNKGYVNGNVQWVTKNVNIAKQSLSPQEFISVCQAVVKKFGM